MSRILRALLVVAITAGLVSAPTHGAQAASYVPITGTGSTWSQNALDQWRKNVAANYGMTVNYSGVGSSAGRRDFIAGTVDFAVSEIPFQTQPEDGSAPEIPAIGFAYMPIVAGGTAFMYNLKISGKRVTNLRLSGEVITKIFTGAITKWNDPAIVADNPALAMPDRTILPVVRSDGSGTSAQFSLWMSKQFPSLWKAGMRSQFPTPPGGKAQNGSLGVAGYVSQDYGEGAITYVEYSYALKSGFPVAKVLNKQGYYVEPTAPSVAVALMSATINSDLTQNLDAVYNSADKRAYPLSSYSYMIIPTEVGGIFTAEKGATLGAFARYMLCEGQQQAPALGYSPLPMNLVQAGSDQIKRIPGAGSAGIDFASCNNPTFKPGDSPNNNRLASSAPQPAECDKVGTSQCSTGTAGAPQDTPVTGGGTGGSSNGGGSGGSGDGGASGAGGAGGDPQFDENGNPLGANNASANGAASKPFTVEDQGMGPTQWLMVAAGGLFFAAVLVPPFVSRRMRAAGRK
ncbi:phosphate ABC transporter substrate-binding protein PstS [Protaetiibacter larvae]|uniref:Phosphate ABC transporter substrate-binding protein PstS n=1 Tax=Protaetiibacter larvae TaxID=2592654 RepID=A0A5C1Y613_9MICO|nr:phosphate ABC transporter substrate-binding protein PstS [Protaetiibacter larvae]QEO09483.1 phosphate ABC transporter substrate-binding protein PstS [Protaetiibacter larvae]